jgi:hypothetical protein
MPRAAELGDAGRASPLASSGAGLLEPQHEFLDLAGACFGEASFFRDDTKTAFSRTRCDATLSPATRE